MRICEVLGNVTLSRAHPTLNRACLLIVAPFGLGDIQGQKPASGEEFVIYDELGAGAGTQIGVSEGREAAMPFHPERKPVDAYCACILDEVHLEQR